MGKHGPSLEKFLTPTQAHTLTLKLLKASSSTRRDTRKRWLRRRNRVRKRHLKSRAFSRSIGCKSCLRCSCCQDYSEGRKRKLPLQVVPQHPLHVLDLPFIHKK